MESTATGWLDTVLLIPLSHEGSRGDWESGCECQRTEGCPSRKADSYVARPAWGLRWKGPLGQASSKEEVKSRRLLGDKKLFSCFCLGFPSVPSGFFWAKHRCQRAVISLVGGVWRDTGPALPISFSHSVLNAAALTFWSASFTCLNNFYRGEENKLNRAFQLAQNLRWFFSWNHFSHWKIKDLFFMKVSNHKQYHFYPNNKSWKGLLFLFSLAWSRWFHSLRGRGQWWIPVT